MNIFGDNGVILKPDLHDGGLIGFLVENETCLVLFLKTHDGHSIKWFVPGLISMRAIDIWKGNVIFELIRHTGPKIDFELLRRARVFQDDKPLLSNDIEMIRAEKWAILEIVGDGCGLCALYERHALEFEFKTELPPQP